MNGAVTPAVLLPASRDPETGEVYVPPRKYAADGSLRACEPFNLPASGTLASWTSYQDEHYGLVDLANGGRIQVLLSPGPHELGAAYHGAHDQAGQVRFVHD